jgi:hypothetical protein
MKKLLSVFCFFFLALLPVHAQSTFSYGIPNIGASSASHSGGSGTVTSVGTSQTGVSFLHLLASPNPITGAGSISLTSVGSTGDIPYFSGTNTTSNLSIGSTGQFLSVVAGVPSWASVPAIPTAPDGRMILASNPTTPFAAAWDYGAYIGMNSTYIVPPTPLNLATNSESVQIIDAGATGGVVNLPPVASCAGKFFAITSVQPDGNLEQVNFPITITPNSGDEIIDEINGTGNIATFTINPGEQIILGSSGSVDWQLYSDSISANTPNISQGSTPAQNYQLFSIYAGQPGWAYGGLVGLGNPIGSVTLTNASEALQPIQSGYTTTLPLASTCPGKIFCFIGSSNASTLATQGSDIIFGINDSFFTSLTVNPSEVIWVVNANDLAPNAWAVFNDTLPPSFLQTPMQISSSTAMNGTEPQTIDVKSGPTLTLPPASNFDGKVYTITNSDGVPAYYEPNGGDSIANLTTPGSMSIPPTALLPGEQITIIDADALVGNTWLIIQDVIPFNQVASTNTTDVGVAHIIGAAGTPTVTVGTTGAGANATASIVGTDSNGMVSVTTSALDTPLPNNALVTVAFSNAYTNSPTVVFVPANTAASNLGANGAYIHDFGVGGTSFVLSSGAVPLPATTAATYSWYYMTMGY